MSEPTTPGPERSATRRVALLLGLFEARRLVRHPAFLVGAAFTVLAYSTVTYFEEGDWYSYGAALTLVLLGWGTIVAANINALRSRRFGTDELLESLPTSLETRTAGHLLSSLGAGVVAIALFIAALLLWKLTRETTGIPNLADVLMGVLVVVGGGAVGVFVARWMPAVLFGYLAVVVTMVLQGNLGGGSAGNRRLYLAFLHDGREVLLGWVMPRLFTAHALWLVGWTLIVAIGALARRGMTRPLGIALAAAVLVTTGAGLVQLRPLSDQEAAVRAASLTDPVSVQDCRDIRRITYCNFPADEDLVEDWATTVDAVLALVPADRPRPTLVTQRVAGTLENSDCAPAELLGWLPAEVAARVSADTVWPRDGQIHPGPGPEELGCSSDSVGWFYLGVQTGSWAVGLPPTEHGLRQRCVADMQARSVVALWLGARATNGLEFLGLVLQEGHLSRTGHVDFVELDGEFDRNGWSKAPQWGTRFLAADLAAAQSLLVADPDDLVPILHAHWDEILDPATSVEDLFGWVGLDLEATPAVGPVGTPACS